MSVRLARQLGVLLLMTLQTCLLAGCAASRPDAEDRVAVTVIDEKGLAEVLKRHQGKVVLVDFWATWCPGCVELLPQTVELHNRLADKGLVVITVSLDDPEDEPAVLKVLRKKAATMENFISKYGGGTRSAEAFQIEGGLPHLKLYDRSGKLHEIFGVDIVSDELAPRIDRAVDELLGRS